MGGSSSASPLLSNFPQVLGNCPSSSSSSPIQNANVVTPQEYEPPVIDRSQSCAEAICWAAKEWRLFQVVNHGICRELLGKMRREQVKLSDNSSRTSSAQFSRPEAFQVPLANIYDRSCYGQFASIGGVMMELAPVMSRRARTLAGVLAKNLGHRGCSTFNESACFLRLNHYPVCPLSLETFRPVPHADSDFLTVLYPDQVGGIRPLEDSRWVVFKPNRDALIVSIGDLLQAWSNEVYRSVEQKVQTNEKILAGFYTPHRHRVRPFRS